MSASPRQENSHHQLWRKRLGICLLGSLAVIGLVGKLLSHPGRPTPQVLSAGHDLFLHEWQETSNFSSDRDPLVAPAGDGLGPVFNGKSCVQCHFQGGVGGAGPNRSNVLAFDVVPTRTNREFHTGVVHALATARTNQESPGEINRLFPTVKGEQRRISGCVITIPEFDPVRFTPINPPALFGVGALAQISDSAVRGYHRQRQLSLYPREIHGDFAGTPAGRARVLPNGKIGRFGWKGQFADLDEFVATACAVELGLSNPKRKQDRPHQQGEDTQAPLDMTSEQLLALTAFTDSLPAPIRVCLLEGPARDAAARGEELFHQIGCADCHPQRLGSVDGLYSDLLLHILEDDREGGQYGRINPDLPLPADQPAPNEWKTPPLWGVADSAPYFHDGGARTLESAILRHGGQARQVTARYRKLPAADQRAVIHFLETLKAPSVEPAPRSNLMAAQD
ncbi:MAG: di-heme oxidoredictase family protein [Planctomycetales bacterium]